MGSRSVLSTEFSSGQRVFQRCMALPGSIRSYCRFEGINNCLTSLDECYIICLWWSKWFFKNLNRHHEVGLEVAIFNEWNNCTFVTCTVVKDINPQESSTGHYRYRNFAPDTVGIVAAMQTRHLLEQRVGIPANELRVGHMVKYRGTPEMVRLTFPLVYKHTWCLFDIG